MPQGDLPDTHLFDPHEPGSHQGCRPIQEEPPGIYELVTVAPLDELPIIFERELGRFLRFELLASAPLAITICTDDSYEAWIDSGMDGPGPSQAVAHVPETECQVIHCTAPEVGDMVAVLFNRSASPVDVFFFAHVSE